MENDGERKRCLLSTAAAVHCRRKRVGLTLRQARKAQHHGNHGKRKRNQSLKGSFLRLSHSMDSVETSSLHYILKYHIYLDHICYHNSIDCCQHSAFDTVGILAFTLTLSVRAKVKTRTPNGSCAAALSVPPLTLFILVHVQATFS
jgi:hypothetical protein